MYKKDFTLLRVDRKDGHEDYWYETSKAANEYLTDKYMEQSMKAVFRVVYSKDEDIVGVERTFPFNYYVITPEDDELKSILRELSRQKICFILMMKGEIHDELEKDGCSLEISIVKEDK